MEISRYVPKVALLCCAAMLLAGSGVHAQDVQGSLYAGSQCYPSEPGPGSHGRSRGRLDNRSAQPLPVMCDVTNPHSVGARIAYASLMVRDSSGGELTPACTLHAFAADGGDEAAYAVSTVLALDPDATGASYRSLVWAEGDWGFPVPDDSVISFSCVIPPSGSLVSYRVEFYVGEVPPEAGLRPAAPVTGAR